MTLQEALDSVSAHDKTPEQVEANASKYEHLIREVAASPQAKSLITSLYVSSLPDLITDPVRVLLMAFGSGVMMGVMMEQEKSTTVLQ